MFRDSERLAKDKLMTFLSQSISPPPPLNDSANGGSGMLPPYPPLSNGGYHAPLMDDSLRTPSTDLSDDSPRGDHGLGMGVLSALGAMPPSTISPSSSQFIPFSPSHPDLTSNLTLTSVTSGLPPLTTTSVNLYSESDLQDLSLEIEKERYEYLEKSKHLHDQLRTLKSEIEELKVDDKVDVMDQLHDEQQEQGETKYSTIQKVKRGSTQSRVAFFEEL